LAEETNKCSVLVEKPLGKWPLGRPRRKKMGG
jgi:hypothetical protein